MRASPRLTLQLPLSPARRTLSTSAQQGDELSPVDRRRERGLMSIDDDEVRDDEGVERDNLLLRGRQANHACRRVVRINALVKHREEQIERVGGRRHRLEQGGEAGQRLIEL